MTLEVGERDFRRLHWLYENIVGEKNLSEVMQVMY